MNDDQHRHCVCIVDDDPDIREIIGLVLEGKGYEVLRAADGQEALEKLSRAHGCGLILLDLMMPGMNGWDFRTAQRSSPELASIPVVVLSGMREVTAQAGDIEAAAYLQKPVDLERLLREVARHCG